MLTEESVGIDCHGLPEQAVIRKEGPVPAKKMALAFAFALPLAAPALRAEATPEPQRVSRFEQLFVVSHDGAFDGHVEHTVALAYSPATGTQVE